LELKPGLGLSVVAVVAEKAVEDVCASADADADVNAPAGAVGAIASVVVAAVDLWTAGSVVAPALGSASVSPSAAVFGGAAAPTAIGVSARLPLAVELDAIGASVGASVGAGASTSVVEGSARPPPAVELDASAAFAFVMVCSSSNRFRS
jgi:hypothetical protein